MMNAPRSSIAKLGDYIEIAHGFAFKSEYFDEDGHYVLLTPGNFQETGGFKWQSKQKRYRGPVDERFLLQAGDLLVAMTEQAEGLLGSALIVPLGDRFLHNQRLGKVTVSGADERFVYYLLNSPGVRRQVRASCTGTKVRHTSPDKIKAVQAVFPPLPAQRRIAAILSTYDDLIKVNTRRIAILEEMARRVYEESATGQKLTLKLPEIGEVTYGYPFKSRQFHDDPSAGVGVIRIRDVRSHNPSTFTAEQGKPHHIVCEGDVLIGMDGEFHMSVWSGPEAWLNQRVARLRATPPYSNALLFEAVRKPIRHLNDTIVGTTVAHLSAKDLKTLEVPRFDEAELKRLNAQLGPMHELAVSLRRQNANLRAQRDLLLPRLVSGKLSVDDAERHIEETAA